MPNNCLTATAICLLMFTCTSLAGESISEAECETYVRNITAINAMHLLEFERQEMMKGYQSSDPKTGIALIEHGIKWLANMRSQNIDAIDEAALTKDMAIFQVRLANLYRLTGDTEHYRMLILDAVSMYQSTGNDINEEQLIALVEKMDESASIDSIAP